MGFPGSRSAGSLLWMMGPSSSYQLRGEKCCESHAIWTPSQAHFTDITTTPGDTAGGATHLHALKGFMYWIRAYVPPLRTTQNPKPNGHTHCSHTHTVHTHIHTLFTNTHTVHA